MTTPARDETTPSTANYADVIRQKIAADPVLAANVDIEQRLGDIEHEVFADLERQLTEAERDRLIAAKLDKLIADRDSAIARAEAAEADNARIVSAGKLLLMCSLPNDVSGQRMVDEAREIINGEHPGEPLLDELRRLRQQNAAMVSLLRNVFETKHNWWHMVAGFLATLDAAEGKS